MRLELDTRRVFKDLQTAPGHWTSGSRYYNQQRPHRSLANATPASRFKVGERQIQPESVPTADYWVSCKMASNGIVCVGYQKVDVGHRNAGSACDILV